MQRQLEAIYENGMLRPLEPLALIENQRVRLTLDERSTPLSWESREPVNPRTEELRWLANHSAPFAGEWVALDGARLTAHGKRLATVSAEAASAGVAEPFFARVPGSQFPFGGW